MSGEWVEPLWHGLTGLAVAGVVFASAKVRFRSKGGAGASTDSGLD